MEITLEKIELVKDRTGVSYREAKEALEKSGGDVVDAIIAIEDEINKNVGVKISDNTKRITEMIKELVRKGNLSRIKIKKDGEIILNMPVTVGVIGTVLAPWLTVIGSVVALGSKHEIVLIKDDGTEIDLSAKVDDAAAGIKDKGADIAEAVNSKKREVRNRAVNQKGKMEDAFDDFVVEAKSKAESAKQTMADKAGEIKDIVADAAGDIKEKVTSVGKDEE